MIPDQKQRVYITLTKEDIIQIEQQANHIGLSRAEFIRQAALGINVTDYLSLQVVTSLIAELNTLSQTTDDFGLRQMLKEAADRLWQSLK